MQSEDEIKRKLSEKFNSYESEPTKESWEKIRASIQLSQMFQDYEANPQEESWEKIRAGIDIVQRMQEYEAEPQEESWEKIRAGVELVEKFKDYEAEPQAISWLKIQEAVQPKKRRRGIFIPIFYRAGIAAGVVLLLGSLWWILNTRESARLTTADSTPKKPSASTSAINPAKNNTKVTSPASEITSAQKTDAIDGGVNNTVASSVSKEKGGISSARAQSKTDLHQPKIKGEVLLAASKADSEIKNDKLPELVNTSPSTGILANASATNETPGTLKGKAFYQRPIRKPFNAIAYNIEKPYQEKEPRVHRDIVFNASLMPLQTYQAFTILPQTNTYIQQVGRLDAIDNQRLGIQLRAGAMKPLSNRFAMGVSAAYTGLQQWANYELNNGDYEVQTGDNGSYTLVGIGELVSQKQFLQTVGLKLDNAYLVSRKKNAVYAIAGAEAVHVLTNKDFGYYVNASIGVSYPIKGGKSLWIEPSFRYSLSQSADANNYLKIRPYNIGLNIRVNFI